MTCKRAPGRWARGHGRAARALLLAACGCQLRCRLMAASGGLSLEAPVNLTKWCEDCGWRVSCGWACLVTCRGPLFRCTLWSSSGALALPETCTNTLHKSGAPLEAHFVRRQPAGALSRRPLYKTRCCECVQRPFGALIVVRYPCLFYRGNIAIPRRAALHITRPPTVCRGSAGAVIAPLA